MYMYMYMYQLSLSLSLFQGGGGLKLTISKAVLKQAASQQKSAPPPSVSPLSTTLFVGPAPTLEVEPTISGRGGRRGSRGGSRRGTLYTCLQGVHVYLYH